MKINKSSFDALICLFISYVIFNIDWELYRNVEFSDRINYINYAENGLNLLEYTDLNSISSYITNEWLWHYLIQYMSLTGNVEFFFSAITFLYLFCVIYFVVRKSGFIALPLIFNPLLIDLAFSQYRIAAAFILAVVFFYIFNKKIIFSFYSYMAAFVHSAMIMFNSLYYVSVWAENKKIETQKKIAIATGLALSLVSGPYLANILLAFNDRRSAYSDRDLSSSLSYLSLWIILLIVFMIEKKQKHKDFIFFISVSLLTVVSMGAITNSYVTRFIALGLPVFAIQVLRLDRNKLYPVYALFAIYEIAQWYYWLK